MALVGARRAGGAGRRVGAGGRELARTPHSKLAHLVLDVLPREQDMCLFLTFFLDQALRYVAGMRGFTFTIANGGMG
ncbi:hypothetical protein BRADI_5g15832v3 [Brachypodium distachyon]|uniref:Uncharacterized protein n=1 Tax=Brachypodium distachyon TaxID=15368 RepID=A0A2K2CHI4_BRADI|nr:hypothetical protein BRADI_5g15832v3 [Brachypodium distachyon]